MDVGSKNVSILVLMACSPDKGTRFVPAQEGPESEVQGENRFTTPKGKGSQPELSVPEKVDLDIPKDTDRMKHFHIQPTAPDGSVG